MSLEATGEVVTVGDVKVISENFSKRNLVLKMGSEEYPQLIEFEFTKERMESLSDISHGQIVTVEFELKGRYYEPNDKYYVSLFGWRCKAESPAPPADGSPF